MTSHKNPLVWIDCEVWPRACLYYGALNITGANANQENFR